MFGWVVFEYDFPYDKAVLLEMYLDTLEEELGFDYTVFDEEYGKLEVVYSLESKEDFEDLRCLLEM